MDELEPSRACTFTGIIHGVLVYAVRGTPTHVLRITHLVAKHLAYALYTMRGELSCQVTNSILLLITTLSTTKGTLYIFHYIKFEWSELTAYKHQATKLVKTLFNSFTSIEQVNRKFQAWNVNSKQSFVALTWCDVNSSCLSYSYSHCVTVSSIKIKLCSLIASPSPIAYHHRQRVIEFQRPVCFGSLADGSILLLCLFYTQKQSNPEPDMQYLIYCIINIPNMCTCGRGLSSS